MKSSMGDINDRFTMIQCKPIYTSGIEHVPRHDILYSMVKNRAILYELFELI